MGEFEGGTITGYGCYYENDIKMVEGIWRDGLLSTDGPEKE